MQLKTESQLLERILADIEAAIVFLCADSAVALLIEQQCALSGTYGLVINVVFF